MKKAKPIAPPTTQDPVSVQLSYAAAYARECTDTIKDKLIFPGEITYHRSNGNVRGSRYLINFAELKVYVAEGLEALREYRHKHGLDKKSKKKERVKK